MNDSILKVAAELLNGGWASDVVEDWPARTSARAVVRVVAADREKRRQLAIRLRELYDDQSRAAT